MISVYKDVHNLKPSGRTQNMMLRVRGRAEACADDPPPPDTIASCEPYTGLGRRRVGSSPSRARRARLGFATGRRAGSRRNDEPNDETNETSETPAPRRSPTRHPTRRRTAAGQLALIVGVKFDFTGVRRTRRPSLERVADAADPS